MSAKKPQAPKALPGAERVDLEDLTIFNAGRAEIGEVNALEQHQIAEARKAAQKRRETLSEEVSAAWQRMKSKSHLGEKDEVNWRTGTIRRERAKGAPVSPPVPQPPEAPKA